ncbi:hypothetical protein H4R19_000451, partial [Coemansia spiralis]
IGELGPAGAEPPLATRQGGSGRSGAELEQAVERLQRKLERFTLYRQPLVKLDAVWTLYEEIKAGSAWRLGSSELTRFLAAIQHTGHGAFWCERAAGLVADYERRSGRAADADTAMALMRLFAKHGDVRQFEAAAQARSGDWVAERHAVVETRAIAYARADLPQQAQEILGGSRTVQVALTCEAPGTRERVPPPHAVALREVLMAWVRRRDAERAWACLGQLLAIGYGRAAREWNAVLHLHAIDKRYRYPLLEQVLMRMREAGVAYDAATYNTMMHGSLLRGLQARWTQWFQRMELDGHRPDVVTYTTLFSQLARTGQWAEARRVVDHMRQAHIQPTPAMTAALMSIDRQRGRSDHVMARFRRQALRGAALSAAEFTLVAQTALDAPQRWAAEIALAIRCLEDGRVAESGVVDALAAQLPGIDAARIAGRPVLQLLRGNPDRTGCLMAEGLAGVAPYVATGDRRRSVAETVNAALRFLARTGRIEQAEQLAQAARVAHVDVAVPHTLVSLAHLNTRAGRPVPHDLAEQLAGATFEPPVAGLIQQLVSRIKGGNLAAARTHYEALEAAADSLPSTRVFNALLMYAAAVPDCTLLERKWQQMALRGIVPDMTSHHTRLFCYSRLDSLLRTRRAYTEMLDYGQPPTFPAVSALVRCCVRAGDLDLALEVVRHAEHDHGTALNTTTYNYVLQCALHRRSHVAVARRMFAAMVRTSDARLCAAADGVARRVAAEKLRFQDLRLLDQRAVAEAGRLPRSVEDQASSDRLRRALVGWLTAREAYSGEPTIGDTAHSAPGGPAGNADPADPPPPTGTTFLIMMRASGQQRQWADVIAAWKALLAFNRRIDGLAARHPPADAHRVVPFSRMVGWVARALLGLGRPDDARAAWAAGIAGGFVSPAAQQLGMDEMLRRLPLEQRAADAGNQTPGD